MANNTVCKNCCFAIWDDITQTGCQRNILERYREVGAKVLECFDDEREFYVIESRFCPYHRNKSWLKAHQDCVEETLDQELRLKFHVIVFANDNIEDLETTLYSLSTQTLLPAKVTVVRLKECGIKPRTIVNQLSNAPYLWSIENQITDVTIEDAINATHKSNQYPYYAVFMAGFLVPQNFFKNINDFILIKLRQFAAILPDDNGNGLVVPNLVHKYWYYHGDPNKSILQNIRDWECINPTPKICFKANEI